MSVAETTYPRTAEPPVVVGAVHETLNPVEVEVTALIAGAAAPVAVIVFTVPDALAPLVPTALIAVIVTV